MLQVIFPGAGTGAVAAAAVRQDQQFIRFGVQAPAARFHHRAIESTANEGVS